MWWSPCMVSLNSLISTLKIARLFFLFLLSFILLLICQMSDYLDFLKSSQFQHKNAIIDVVQNIISKLESTKQVHSTCIDEHKCVTFPFSSFSIFSSSPLFIFIFLKQIINLFSVILLKSWVLFEDWKYAFVKGDF